MLARNDLALSLADNYGRCKRGTDCYHGKDERGNFNGCLRTGWRGTLCPHWVPTEARDLDELRAEMIKFNGAGDCDE